MAYKKLETRVVKISVITKTKVTPGSIDHCPGGKIVAVWWRDRRDVLALSTMHNTSASVVMKRQKGCHEKRPIP